ncbi:hypothetical protein MMC26_006251 [Xylographa opegraphella]|nr:hypothetical protein [Xylographa opegraphella]
MDAEKSKDEPLLVEVPEPAEVELGDKDVVIPIEELPVNGPDPEIITEALKIVELVKEIKPLEVPERTEVNEVEDKEISLLTEDDPLSDPVKELPMESSGVAEAGNEENDDVRDPEVETVSVADPYEDAKLLLFDEGSGSETAELEFDTISDPEAEAIGLPPFDEKGVAVVGDGGLLKPEET